MMKAIAIAMIVFATAAGVPSCDGASRQPATQPSSQAAKVQPATGPSSQPDRYARLLVEIGGLSRGMEAREVYRRLGKPDLWGNWDESSGGFNTSWMTTGGYGPLPVPEEKMHYRIVAPADMAPHILDWLYCLNDGGTFEKVAIIRFQDYKLHRTYTTQLSLIYDP